jgi:ABC-type multidrug transport system fused ATPase/permease subunit
VAFYDLVMVMDKGQLVEFDTPLRLLEQPAGVFKSMAEMTGDYEHLLQMAKTASINRSH